MQQTSVHFTEAKKTLFSCTLSSKVTEQKVTILTVEVGHLLFQISAESPSHHLLQSLSYFLCILCRGDRTLNLCNHRTINSSLHMYVSRVCI